MLDQAVASYGVTEAEAAGDEVGLAFEELVRTGSTLLDSGLSEEAVADLRSRLDRVYEQQAESAAGLESTKDADVARCLLAYDDAFIAVATNPRLIDFCGRVFGEGFMLLQQNGVINRPGRAHYQLQWHRDLPFQHWVASKAIAISALLCLDDFNSRTGGTHVLPGSHQHESFPSEAFVRAHQRAISAAAGTFIVMDAMVFHRAGNNTSEGPRRGVNHLIGPPFLAQQVDIPRMLGEAHADDPFLARYLGYRWSPAESVEAWRAARR